MGTQKRGNGMSIKSNRQKRSKIEANSTAKCAVCSDPAPSRNFDAITCAACAAFFRKSIADGRVYKCRRDGKCELYKEVRNRCRCCRLVKCLRAGMREELVQKRVKEGEESKATIKKEEKLCKDFIDSKTLPSSLYAHWSADASTVKTLLELEKQILRPEIDISSTGLNDGENNDENHSTILLNNPAEFGLEIGEQVDDNGYLPWLNPWEEDQRLCTSFADALLYDKHISVEDRHCLLQYIKWPAIFMQCCYDSTTAKNDNSKLMASAGICAQQIYNSEKQGDDPNLRKMSTKLLEEPLKLWHRVRPEQHEFVLLLALMHTHVATPGLSAEGRQILHEESKRYSGCLVRLQQDQYGHWEGIIRHMETMDMISACFEAAQQHAELDALMNVDSHMNVDSYMNVFKDTPGQTHSPAHDHQMGADIHACSPSSDPPSILTMIPPMTHSSHSIQINDESIDLIEDLPDNMAPESSPHLTTSDGITTMITQRSSFITKSAINSTSGSSSPPSVISLSPPSFISLSPPSVIYLPPISCMLEGIPKGWF